MRTVTGLIVGLGLGILLMYSTVSTVRVQRLKDRVPTPASAPVAAPAVAEAPSLAQRLGAAAGQAACAGIGAEATVLLLCGAGDESAAQAAAGFRGAAAAPSGPTLVEVASPTDALAQIGTAARLFCPNHDLLRELLEKAGDRVLPPVYTVGWSAWLIGACARAVPPAAGVAVVDPAAAVRLVTPLSGAPATPPLTTATAPVVVLAPAEFVAFFSAVAVPPVAEPVAKP